MEMILFQYFTIYTGKNNKNPQKIGILRLFSIENCERLYPARGLLRHQWLSREGVGPGHRGHLFLGYTHWYTPCYWPKRIS